MNKSITLILVLLLAILAGCKQDNVDLYNESNSVYIRVFEDGYMINTWAEKTDRFVEALTLSSEGKSNEAVSKLMTLKNGPVTEHLVKYLKQGEKLHISVNGEPSLSNKIVEEIELLKNSFDIELTQTNIKATVERL